MITDVGGRKSIEVTDAKKSGGEMKAYLYTYTGYAGFCRKAWTAKVSQEVGPTDV